MLTVVINHMFLNFASLGAAMARRVQDEQVIEEERPCTPFQPNQPPPRFPSYTLHSVNTLTRVGLNILNLTLEEDKLDAGCDGRQVRSRRVESVVYEVVKGCLLTAKAQGCKAQQGEKRKEKTQFSSPHELIGAIVTFFAI